jgi:hypothetical protein
MAYGIWSGRLINQHSFAAAAEFATDQGAGGRHTDDGGDHSDCFLSEIVTGFAASVAQQSCRAKFVKAGLRLLDQCPVRQLSDNLLTTPRKDPAGLKSGFRENLFRDQKWTRVTGGEGRLLHR